jgi:hypothetical protein
MRSSANTPQQHAVHIACERGLELLLLLLRRLRRRRCAMRVAQQCNARDRICKRCKRVGICGPGV